MYSGPEDKIKVKAKVEVESESERESGSECECVYEYECECEYEGKREWSYSAWKPEISMPLRNSDAVILFRPSACNSSTSMLKSPQETSRWFLFTIEIVPGFKPGFSATRHSNIFIFNIFPSDTNWVTAPG